MRLEIKLLLTGCHTLFLIFPIFTNIFIAFNIHLRISLFSCVSSAVFSAFLFWFSHLHSLPAMKLRIRPVKPTIRPAAKIHYRILFRNKNFIQCILMLETCTCTPLSPFILLPAFVFTLMCNFFSHIYTRSCLPSLLALILYCHSISPFDCFCFCFCCCFFIFPFLNFLFFATFMSVRNTASLYFFAHTHKRTAVRVH